MLTLAAPRWAELQHAYGSAVDIPPLLSRLSRRAELPTSAREEPLDELWQSLCHQGTPDEAAYAALPHLVDIAAARSARERPWVLHLVGSVAAPPGSDDTSSGVVGP